MKLYSWLPPRYNHLLVSHLPHTHSSLITHTRTPTLHSHTHPPFTHAHYPKWALLTHLPHLYVWFALTIEDRKSSKKRKKKKQEENEGLGTRLLLKSEPYHRVHARSTGVNQCLCVCVYLSVCLSAKQQVARVFTDFILNPNKQYLITLPDSRQGGSLPLHVCTSYYLRLLAPPYWNCVWPVRYWHISRVVCACAMCQVSKPHKCLVG